jgi:hypothetical protein
MVCLPPLLLLIPSPPSPLLPPVPASSSSGNGKNYMIMDAGKQDELPETVRMQRIQRMPRIKLLFIMI